MIKVTLALLADFASISQGGKINILGIFDSLYAEILPVVIPHMYLVLRFEGEGGEANKQYNAELQLINEDGAAVISLPGVIMLHHPPSGKYISRYDHIFPLFNLQLEQFGNYEFKIFINNEIRGSVPFSIHRMDAPPLPITDINEN